MEGNHSMESGKTPHLTADCVYNAFLSSGKRHLLLTGGRGKSAPSVHDDVFVVDLERPFGAVGCVIMASGQGKRFGGNKLMAAFDGAPMICRILDATTCFKRRVVVTRHADVALLCRERGIETVLHTLPLRSDTVRLGLEALEGVTGCMFCPADQPLLRADTVRALALCAANDPASIWRVTAAGQVGTPTLFPQWCFPELRSLPEGKGGGVLAKKYPERVRYLTVADPGELMDVDTPEDLLRLQSAYIK